MIHLPMIPPGEQRRTVFVDGVTLEVIARPFAEGGWELSILNALGVYTTWYEPFACADDAIEAGMTAIALEGVDEFANSDDFPYPGAMFGAGAKH